jgi:hypothetical protein
VCSVPSDEAINPALIKTTAPAPKNLIATSRATEESFETEAICVGSST